MRTLSIDSRVRRLGMDIRGIPGLEAVWLSRFPYGLGTMALPADGTAMGTWVDLSGKGRDLTQGTAGSQPLWRRAGVNLLTANQATGTDALGDTTGFTPYVTTVTSDSTWALSGGKSLKVTPTGALNDTAAFVGGSFDFGALSPGTYTFSATIHLEAAQSGTFNNNTRLIDFQTSDGSGAKSNSAPNAPGSYRLSVTVNVVAGRTYWIRLYNGSDDPNSPVWWDNLQLEQSPIATPWLPPGNAQGMQFAAGDFLSSVPFNMSGPRTIYFVYQLLNANNSVVVPLYDGRVNGVERNQLAYSPVPGNNLATYTVAGNGVTNIGPLANSNRHVATFTFDSTPRNQFLDGSNIATITTGIDNITQGFNVSADRQATANLNGLIHDMIICSQAHDDATRQRVEAGLARANGVTLAP